MAGLTLHDLASGRDGTKCTSYTAWPCEYLQQYDPQTLLTSIKVQKVIAQASFDKRLSSCCQATRKQNKPKKRSCFFFPERNCESLPLNHGKHINCKKRRKRHKSRCVDPFYIKDIDDIDILIATVNTENPEENTSCKPEMPRLPLRPSPEEGLNEDKDVKGKEEAQGSVKTDAEKEQGDQSGNRAAHFTVFVRQLNNEIVTVPLRLSDTLVQLRTVIKCPAAEVKFYHCGKQLKEDASLQEQGVQCDSNIELHVALQGGADNDPDSRPVERELSDNMEEWSEEDVEMWLRKHVKLKDVYIQKLKEEEVNGHNVKNLFTLDYLQTTIKMKSGPALKVLGKRDAFKNKAVQTDKIEVMTVEDVCKWMKGVKVKEKYLAKFQEEEFDGWNLKYSLDDEYLEHTIGMKSGPRNCLLDNAKELLHKEKVPPNTLTSASLQPVVRPKETQGPTTPKPVKQPSAAKRPVSSRMKEYQEMLKNRIHLKTKEYDPKDSTTERASLDLICSKWGQNQNEMDAHFCFLLLSKGKLDVEKSQQKNLFSKIWTKISDQLQDWVSLLSPTEKANYGAVKGSRRTMMIKRNKQAIELSQKAPRCGPIMRRPANEIENHSKIILIVDNGMLTSQNTTYHMYLDNDRARGLTFEFSKNHYWNASFDPDDLSVPFAFNMSDLTAESFEHLKVSDSDHDSDQAPESEQRELEESASVPLSLTQPMQCAPRPFGEYGQYSYHNGRVLAEVETGVTNLLHPAHEFKFSIKEGDQLVDYFIEETLRFSCACLNVRTNGTIHFGITDDKSGEYHNAEVLGVSVNDKERAKFEEELTSFIDRCFQQKAQKEAAKTCIGPPIFVKVSGMKESRYVIEVDVTPKAMECGSLAFKVRLPRFTRGKKQAYSDPKYYERVGSSSCLVTDEDLADETFFERVRKAKIRRQEKEAMAVTSKPKNLQDLAERLKSLLCYGRPRQMSSFYHILVTNKPPAGLVDKGYLSFIKCIDWVAVFDFDPDSYASGLAKVYEDKGMNEYFPEEFSNRSLGDIEDFCHEIKFRTLPLWLSCNGRNDKIEVGTIRSQSGAEVEMRPFDVKEWYEKRRKGVKDAISFLSREEIIPDQSKVVITFLLFSDDYEIIADTFRNFADDFKIDRLLYIAESDAMLHGWNIKLEEVYAEDKHRSRGIVGMPWNHVNESIKQFVGVAEEGEGILPTSTGSGVPLKERDRKLWKYLDIVCQNQCENSEMLTNKEALERHRQEKEEEFWKGKKVDWWNFWFTDSHTAVNGQVLTRDDHEKLKTKVRNNLRGDIEGEWRMVNIVQLFHHPGAGGSTMARHVLWDFRKEYRCAVVTSPTLETCEQILDLYSYEEPKSENRRPVLILVEDIDAAELRRFKVEIESVINKRLAEVGKLPVCVLLHCMRSASAQDLKQQNTIGSIVLEQHLSQREINWCNRQLETCLQLSERDPRQFLSFMIFKENFDTKYIEDTVREILCTVDLAKSEKAVLKYVSLLNTFVKDSGIPVARCKAILGINPRNPHGDRIEDLLSPSAQLLLVEISKEEAIGTVPCYSTAHPLVAVQILNQLNDKDNQTYGEVALEFIKSEIFMDYRFAREYMVAITGQMLKKRQRNDDNTEEKFSPLILHICEKENDVTKALQIMTTAYDRFGDGILAQQAARLFSIKARNFEKARHYARQGATDKRSSYTLDTVGQVEKEEFIFKFQSNIEKQSELSPEHAKEAIKLAFQAMSYFHDAQRANYEEGARNLAGFVGEVQVCFLLLKLLQCIPRFKGEEGRKYLIACLMGDKVPPSPIKDCWDEHQSGFRQLHDRMDKALKYIANLETYYKHDLNASKTPFGRSNTVYLIDSPESKKFLVANYRNYALYFCMSSDVDLNDVRDEAVKCELRRSQVAALRGNNFFNIFELVARKHIDTLTTIRDMLKANVNTPELRHKKPSDIQNYILVNLALASIDKQLTGIPSLNELCKLAERLVDMCDGSEAYPYFLIYMFMWPNLNMSVDYKHSKFKDALKKLDEIHRKHSRSREEQKPHHKIQATEYQPRASTLFFLGKTTRTVQQFVYVGQLPPIRHHALFVMRGLQSSVKRDQFWKNPAIPQILQRLKGTQIRGTIYVKNVKLTGRSREVDNIEVRPALPIRSGSRIEEVSFYLGFSWAGPVAYDVQRLSDDTAFHSQSTMTDTLETDELGDVAPEEETQFDYEQFQAEMANHQATLDSVEELKKRRDKGEALNKKERKKVESEGDVLKKMNDLIQQCREHLESNIQQI